MHQTGLFPAEKGHIGTDESGKGDYFGPLVVAGVYVPDEQEAVLKELGVRDSKRLTDNRVREMADLVRKGYKQSVVAIGPEKYNELYGKLRNLNRILAWAHARAIENILEEVACTQAITDQFGDRIFVENAMMKKGRNIELIQRPKAEEDMAVAAASIFKIDLPKGSSSKSEEVGLELVEKYGADVLDKVAKKHFKLTPRILGLAKDKK